MSSEETCNRNRGWLIVCIILCIFLGLASRSSLPFPTIFRLYAGDILWSTMFYFIFVFFKPNAKMTSLFLATLLFSFLIEYSQLIDWDWLNAARQTPLRYLLGQGFQYSDLLCYVLGSALGFVIDKIIWLITKERICNK